MIRAHGGTALICIALLALAAFVARGGTSTASGDPAPRSAETWAAEFLIAVRNDPILTNDFSPAPGVAFDPGEADRWLWRWTRIRASAEPTRCRTAAEGVATVWRSVGPLIGPDGTITEGLDAADAELWERMGTAAAAASRDVEACVTYARGVRSGDVGALQSESAEGGEGETPAQ